jgi:hypothetical protein
MMLVVVPWAERDGYLIAAEKLELFSLDGRLIFLASVLAGQPERLLV